MTPPMPETTSSGGGHSDDDEPYEPSYTPPLEKRPRQAGHHAAGGGTPVADDEDVPYDPEENEVGGRGRPVPGGDRAATQAPSLPGRMQREDELETGVHGSRAEGAVHGFCCTPFFGGHSMYTQNL